MMVSGLKVNNKRYGRPKKSTKKEPPYGGSLHSLSSFLFDFSAQRETCGFHFVKDQQQRILTLFQRILGIL